MIVQTLVEKFIEFVVESKEILFLWVPVEAEEMSKSIIRICSVSTEDVDGILNVLDDLSTGDKAGV